MFRKIISLLVFLIKAHIYFANPLPQNDEFIEYGEAQEPPNVPSGFCILPKELDYSGYGRPINDCEDNKLELYKAPPPGIWTLKGSYPMICCPRRPITKKIDVPDCTDEDYDEYGLKQGVYCEYRDEAEFETFQYKSAEECKQNSTCTIKSQCGLKDFSNGKPPEACGYEETTGEDKFCCQDTGPTRVTVKTSQPPLFPNVFVLNPRPCIDHTAQCTRWAKDHPESCIPGNLGYAFMREACQESCGRCGEKGCVDEYEKCPEWSRAGHCTQFPAFMFFNCRESCGACGFKSPLNQEVQVVNGRQYTDFNSQIDHSCGDFKKRKDWTEISLDQDELNNQEEGLCTGVIISDRFALTAAHCLEEGAKRFDIKKGSREVTIRGGSEYQEKIGVKREWIHPWRQTKKTSQPAYYDIVVQELERRIIFDYDKYGDSPNCLGKDELEDLSGQVGLTQGFGKTELENEGAGKLLEANVTIISNADCYEKLNNIITTNINGYNSRTQIKQAIYDGITDQLLCTEGLVVKREVCRRNGRGCRTREFITGPCQGDSGGPLYLEKINEDGDVTGRTVVGIVSGGIGCGSSKKPNFPKWWARVSKFNKWIKCTKKNAAKYTVSHKSVERACDDFFEAYPATPSLPVCTHSGLFIEEGDYETCLNLPLEEKCFGIPTKPDNC